MAEIYIYDDKPCYIISVACNNQVVVKFFDESEKLLPRIRLKYIPAQDIPKEFYLKIAILKDPSGKICGVCGKENTFVDDYGFIYILSASIPCCESCWKGKAGEIHKELFGVGDR